MTPGLLDHLFVALLVVAAPWAARRAYHKLVAAVARGDATALQREYRFTILLEWLLVAALLVAWLLAGRSLATLGFRIPPDRRSLWGAAAAIGALAFFVWQWRAVLSQTGEQLEPLRKQMASVAAMLPRTEPEYRLFRGVAFTAGTAEEILYRGYLIWYFSALLGPWPGLVAAVLAFGAGHAYQGGMGIIRTGVVGFLLALLYVFTGSLLWPMIVHTIVDLQGGALGYRLLRTEPR